MSVILWSGTRNSSWEEEQYEGREINTTLSLNSVTKKQKLLNTFLVVQFDNSLLLFLYFPTTNLIMLRSKAIIHTHQPYLAAFNCVLLNNIRLQMSYSAIQS